MVFIKKLSIVDINGHEYTFGENTKNSVLDEPHMIKVDVYDGLGNLQYMWSFVKQNIVYVRHSKAEEEKEEIKEE